MSEDRKSTSRHLLEMWGDNAPHRPTDYLAANYVNHQLPDAEGGISDKSIEEWKTLVTDFHHSFSDARLELLLQIEEGDYVCTRWQMTAKHTGSFRGIEPTGKETTWTGVQTDRYEGGKLVESWIEWDKYRWLEGLGLVN